MAIYINTSLYSDQLFFFGTVMQCVYYTWFQAQQIELESVNNDEDYVVASLVSIYNCTKHF